MAKHVMLSCIDHLVAVCDYPHRDPDIDRIVHALALCARLTNSRVLHDELIEVTLRWNDHNCSATARELVLTHQAVSL